MSVWRARTSDTAKSCSMTRTTTSDAFEGPTTCADLVATLKAPKAHPTPCLAKDASSIPSFRRAKPIQRPLCPISAWRAPPYFCIWLVMSSWAEPIKGTAFAFLSALEH
jgi:hypothetical protein